MTLETNSRKKTGKSTNVEIKQHTLNLPIGQKRIHREINPKVVEGRKERLEKR